MALSNVPLDSNETEELMSVNYPAKKYELCYFNINDLNN
jgi:hypothetical protein